MGIHSYMVRTTLLECGVGSTQFTRWTETVSATRVSVRVQESEWRVFL